MVKLGFEKKKKYNGNMQKLIEKKLLKTDKQKKVFLTLLKFLIRKGVLFEYDAILNSALIQRMVYYAA